jgi:NADPH:quinone reductase
VLEDVPKPEPKEGQLLIRVEGTTINPSDRMRLTGSYFPVPLPATMGLEGTGRVIEAKGEALQHWVGKRVSFVQAGLGTWGEFSLADPERTFEIDEDVSLTSAASGIVNPLTVIGMTKIFGHTKGKKGIIHTGAASALGRMLNKYCQTLGIPLLNIVRREEQAELLKKEGAKHVIITKGDWQEEYKAAIKEHGFNVFFDALGGGETLEALISGLGSNSWVHIYGAL